MVCIIDDREDVWNYAHNLICVKPYVFFKNTGDINDPTQQQQQQPTKSVASAATSTSVASKSSSISKGTLTQTRKTQSSKQTLKKQLTKLLQHLRAKVKSNSSSTEIP